MNDYKDAGGRAPKVGALGDAWSGCRELEVIVLFLMTIIFSRCAGSQSPDWGTQDAKLQLRETGSNLVTKLVP